MSKQISVNNGLFSVIDTISNRIEFQSLASETYLGKMPGRYYFYYDTFPVGDSIKKSRSIDYALTDLTGATGAYFNSEEELQYWVDNNLAATSEEEGVAVSIVTGYISEYEADGYIYSGYNKDSITYIIRYKEGVVETASGVTNLSTDWINRLNLIYN